MKPSCTRVALATLCTIFATGCSSDAPMVIEDEPGSIQVSVATTGVDLDADGYTIDVGGSTMALAVDGSVTFSGLDAGSYTATLSGLAANCTVDGDDAKPVTVVSAQTASVAFSVACERIPGPNTLVAANELGDIFLVDEDTGVATFLYDTQMSDGAGGTVDLGVVSSMSYIPTTDKWWLGMGGNSPCDGCIMTFDPSTLVATMLYQRPDGNGISGLAVHPDTDRIFSFPSDEFGDLYELNALTGEFTTVATTGYVGYSGNGTTFSSSGNLYVVGDSELYLVDIVTGAETLIGAVALTGFPTLQYGSPDVLALATRSTDGAVFGLLRDGNRRNSAGTYIFLLNLDTAEAVLVGETTDLLEGLAFIPNSMISP